jgi:hypothetical protein
MNNKNTFALQQKLQDAIGGEWQATRADAPLKGYVANFPKFRSDAIVGVINDAAIRAGASEQAVSFRSGAGSDLLSNMPDAPRDVVIPRELAHNPAFHAQLDASMKQTITHVVSQQLSYAAGQGFQR